MLTASKPAIRREAGTERPPVVARGALLARGVYVGLDYIRAVGPDALREAATEWLCAKFGAEFEPGKGFNFYGASLAWSSGAKLLYRHQSGTCCVELTGGVLSSVDADTRVAWLRELMALGFKIRRLDVATDFVDMGLNLCESVENDARDGYLCRCKRWSPSSDRRADGRMMGRTIYFGLRGNNGAGRMIRVYDKGLETGEYVESARWERFEAEFCESVSETIADAIGREAAWLSVALKYAFGAVEFRELAPGKNRSYKNRPLRPWWAAILALVDTARVAATRTKTNLRKYVKWIRRSVVPTLAAMAGRAGLDTAQVTELIFAGCGPSQRALASDLIREFENWYKSDAPYAIYSNPCKGIGYGLHEYRRLKQAAMERERFEECPF